MNLGVIGIGNPARGDDGLGPAVLARLAGRLPARVRRHACDGEATRLLAAWEGLARVWLIDALRGAGAPGTLRRFDLACGAAPPRFASASTHAFGLAEALALGEALGQRPPGLVLYGIEGADFTAGAALSPVVAGTLGTLVEALCGEIEEGLQHA